MRVAILMPLSDSRARLRLGFVALAMTAIGLGLAVHWGGGRLPPMLRDVLGDALWATMIAGWVGIAVPRMAPGRRGLAAFGICALVEFSQLYHAPMLDALRRTTLGHLVLGSDFDGRDFAAYGVGVLVAMWLERRLFSRR